MNGWGSFGASWEFIFGSFRVHWGHWKLLEDCLGFIRIALRVIGGYWGIVGVLFGVRWEFIWSSK